VTRLPFIFDLIPSIPISQLQKSNDTNCLVSNIQVIVTGIDITPNRIVQLRRPIA
jgi:hypothetical protein